MLGENAKSKDCISLLKMIIHMKAKEAVEEKIFPKGDELLFEWLLSMQFKFEMILVVEEGLKETEAKVKKDQDRDYELLRGLHTNSQASGKGKGIGGVAIMQKNFSNYLDSLTEKSFDHQNSVRAPKAWRVCTHGCGRNAGAVECNQRSSQRAFQVALKIH